MFDVREKTEEKRLLNAFLWLKDLGNQSQDHAMLNSNTFGLRASDSVPE
jgi:hypothetical protein